MSSNICESVKKSACLHLAMTYTSYQLRDCFKVIIVLNAFFTMQVIYNLNCVGLNNYAMVWQSDIAVTSNSRIRVNGCDKDLYKKQIKIEIKSSLYSRYYAEACNLTSGGAHLPDLAPKKRRSGGEQLATVSDMVGSEIEPRTSRTDYSVLNHFAYRRVKTTHLFT